MLEFLPVLILLAAAVTGTLLVLAKRGGGFIWSISFISSLAIWILALVVPVSSYKPVLVTNWLPFSQIFSGFAFSVDLVSTSFIFCVSSILLSFVIASTIHMQKGDWSRGIILVLFTGAMGVLSLTSLDPYSLVITWTLLDFFTLGSDLWFAKDNRVKQNAVTSFTIKVISSLAIMAGVALSGGKGFNFDLTAIPSQIGLIFLLAIVFRFWGIMYNFPKGVEDYLFSTQVLIKLISLAAAFSLLSRIPIGDLSETGRIWILISIILVGFWSTIRVMLSSNLSSAIPYFLTGFGCIQLFCAIGNHSSSTIIWSCLALFIGSLLGVFKKFKSLYSILPSIGLLLAIGLPFTLGGMGLFGLIDPFSAFSILILIVLLGMLVGIVRIVWQMDIVAVHIERPTTIVYMIGIVVLPFSSIILGMKNSQGLSSNSNLFISGILLIVGVIASVVYYRVRNTFHPQGTASRFIRFVRQGQKMWKWNLAGKIIRSWMRLMDISINIISRILEGDGGFLWTLVLLAVMISVISPGGS